jgi:hypothetical protein
MIRIEITGRDDFWRDAVMVEWQHQYPQRSLTKDQNGLFVIENDWLEDLKRVASECFSTIVVAPADPGRRTWFRQFLPRESR